MVLTSRSLAHSWQSILFPIPEDPGSKLVIGILLELRFTGNCWKSKIKKNRHFVLIEESIDCNDKFVSVECGFASLTDQVLVVYSFTP